MKVFLIGGTGFLGRHLIPKLLQSNHKITVLTRRKEEANKIEKLGVVGVIGDLLNPEKFIDNLGSNDVVIHIAMPKVNPGRISKREFKILQEQTTNYVKSSIAISQKFDCPLILTLGTSFRTFGEEVADESWELNRYGMAKIGEYVEPMLKNVIKTGTPPLIQVLPGQIYGPGGLFLTQYDWIKKGKYRIFGDGSNFIPKIHVDDCADAYVKILEKMPLGEKFIIADDCACTSKEFSDFIAEKLNLPKIKKVPAFIIKLVVGKIIYDTIMMNCKVSNAKAKKILNWKPKFPTFKEGLIDTINSIEHNNSKKSEV